ncbi:MAG: pantetheine-phosphate adenylyltransferase [Rhodospirillales bacterium]|nr:pantetheine-phosphate adenylyltransferase [Rhodospirillales bacterium]MCW8952801.1 pantetheine-phosphate adenylyltransferase [Rhodospirillales bacterium]MCW9003577.1 pantetheine-phosphate adenylyltransferase [Rhodospirillales bacterium]MCW9039666.1 pantetheine-phosphate adenylyltransferase [Rhodospirillales bacterium]
MVERVGVYPGTFDPVTFGHLDIIKRAAKVLNRLIIAVATNPGKGPLFSVEERVAMIEAEVADLTLEHGMKVEVVAFDNLLMDFVVSQGAEVIVRGLRAVSDFEYEFQMAGMNARLNPKVETMFLMASDRHQLIASRLVKEIGWLGGDVGQFAPQRVVARMQERFAERRAAGENTSGG